MSNTQKPQGAKQELAVIYDIDGEQIKLTPSIVQKYIVGDGNGQITLPEFKFFTELCKVRKLNPFLKEAYCIKFGSNPAQIVVGKDAVLKRAVLNPNFDGIESGIIVFDTNTCQTIERKGTFHLKEEQIVGGWAKVYRKDWTHPTYCSVAFDEVAQRTKDGFLNKQWATKGGTMVEKVAKVRALRETFVEDLGGMYEADELPTSPTRMNEDFPVEPEIIPQEEPEIVSQPEPENEPIDVSFDEL